MSGPLTGFRVIDVCRAGPGQWATGLLADYGADVVTIVEPGHAQRRAAGGGASPESGRLNRRNKRSIFLNLRADGALDVFFKLAADSDALLESNRPGVAKRLGIEYEAVRAANPRIVYCSLSGFGQTGPYAKIAAHDLSFQAVGGMAPLTEEGVPRIPAYNQADLNAANFAAMAILMGLLGRTTTGEGQYIDVAFADVSVTLPPGRMPDPGLRGFDPGYSIYETKDGRYVTMSTREPWFWERLCRMAGHQEWIPSIRPQGEVRDEIFAALRELFRGKTLAEWMPILEEHDLQFGPLNSTEEDLLADPQLRAREMVLETKDPATGQRRLEPGLAFKFGSTPAEVRRGPSPMGADTDAVLTELGYDAPEIGALRQAGVVG